MESFITIELKLDVDCDVDQISKMRDTIATAAENGIRRALENGDLTDSDDLQSIVELYSVDATVAINTPAHELLGDIIEGVIPTCIEITLLYPDGRGGLNFMNAYEPVPHDGKSLVAQSVEQWGRVCAANLAALRLADSHFGTDTSDVQKRWIEAEPELEDRAKRIAAETPHLIPLKAWMDVGEVYFSTVYRDGLFLQFYVEEHLPF